MVTWRFKPNEYTTQCNIKVYFTDNSSVEYTFSKVDGDVVWSCPTTITGIGCETLSNEIRIWNSETSSKLIKNFDVTYSNDTSEAEKPRIFETQPELSPVYAVFDKNLFDFDFYSQMGFHESLWNQTTMEESRRIVPLCEKSVLALPSLRSGEDSDNYASFSDWAMYDNDYFDTNGKPQHIIDVAGPDQPKRIPTPNKRVDTKLVPTLLWAVTNNDGTKTLSASQVKDIMSCAKDLMAYIIPAGDSGNYVLNSK